MSTYLIIGGSSGIGRALAQHLADEGHTVHATYHQHPVQHATIRYHSLNVLEEAPLLDFLPETIDGIAYCPGSIVLKPFARIRPEDFMADLQLNTLGAIRILQALLPRLKSSRQASVVLFSTVAVQLGLPFHTAVAVSKGAIEGLTRSLAAELAPKVRVNCIAPSLTDTPLAAALLSTEEKRLAGAQRHPLKSLGQPEDLARMAAFLLTDQSRWITGQVINVDGGLSAVRL